MNEELPTCRVISLSTKSWTTCEGKSGSSIKRLKLVYLIKVAKSRVSADGFSASSTESFTAMESGTAAAKRAEYASRASRRRGCGGLVGNLKADERIVCIYLPVSLLGWLCRRLQSNLL